MELNECDVIINNVYVTLYKASKLILSIKEIFNSFYMYLIYSYFALLFDTVAIFSLAPLNIKRIKSKCMIKVFEFSYC